MRTVKRMIAFPINILRPLQQYLVSTMKQLELRKRRIRSEDPFSDPGRVDDNASLDADAAEISGHDRAEAFRVEVDRRIITVRKALTKIRLGRYGLCENCGKMIDTDRLAVNPTAELCMDCEKKRKR